MKILRSFTMIAALASATTVYADTPAKAKEAPTKADPKAPPAKDAKPAPKAEVSAADAEKFLAFFNKFVDATIAAKDDCNKMAASMNALIDKNQGVIKMANQAKAEGKDLPAATKEKMMNRVMKEMGPAMQKCGADAKVQAALTRMDDQAKKTDAKAPPPTTKTAPAKK